MRYILYARKSEEDKMRQVQSIDDQVRELHALADRKNLTVTRELREEQSAKAPGRPQFDAMMQAIRRGEADGVLVWSINRLLRNPIDEGTIKWMLQEGVLRSIQTMDKEHTPLDNVMIIGVESGVATQFILDLRKGVLRGLQSKLEKGWYPHRAPLGYLNDKFREKGDKTILPDPELFPLIRKAWDLLLTGGYTVPQIQTVLNTQWGVRTPARRGGGGGQPVPRSTLYRLFANIFYAGYFYHNGTLYKGAHPAMVSMEEFDRAQKIIGVESTIRPKTQELAFTGLIRCATCGGWVTGGTKVKPSGRRYTYYHCQNPAGACGKGGLREDRLNEQAERLLAQVTILPEFHAWAVEAIEELGRAEREKQQAVYAQRLRALSEADKQLDALLGMRMRDLITDEEYSQKKESLVSERSGLHKDLARTEQAADTSRQSSLNAAEFCLNARGWFQTGDANIKRGVAKALGASWKLENGVLSIEPHPMLVPVREKYLKLETKYRKIGLMGSGSESTKRQALEPVRLVWSGIWESNRIMALERDLLFPRLTPVTNVRTGWLPPGENKMAVLGNAEDCQ